MKTINIYACLLTLFIIGCKNNNEEKTEKFQMHRNKIINVEDKIIDIKTEVLFGNSQLHIIDDILLVVDMKSSDKGIHLFNKNTFKYLVSTGTLGKGPGEIVRYGIIASDSKDKAFWVSDYAKLAMWKFYIDSVLNNEMYKPTKELDLNNYFFLGRYDFLNDSIALGKAIDVINNNSYVEVMVKFNLNSNKTEKFGYKHPEAVGKKSRSYFKLSVENNIYVNCHSYSDLMTICDLQGNLKYNVYGPGWLNNKDNKKSYYFGVCLTSNNIIAAYIGDVGIIFDEYQRPRGNLPSKLLVFDMHGNYKETIETGYKFNFFCVDEENKRVIAYFEDRDNPLGYFYLNLD